MKLYKIYFSPTGGTKKVADILCGKWDYDEDEIDIFSSDEEHNFLKEDVCLFAVPSYGGRVPSVAVERLKKLHGNGTRAILTVVYGNREFEDTLIELKDIMEENGFVCPIAVSAIAEHSVFRQFAQGRPDNKDKKQLESFAIQIKEYLHQGGISSVAIPGTRPYKKYNGIPLKPVAGKECTRCGLCAKECPTGAISLKDIRKVDKTKCISCMHCVEICPAGVRKTNKLLKTIAFQKMKKVCSKRKENHLYI